MPQPLQHLRRPPFMPRLGHCRCAARPSPHPPLHPTPHLHCAVDLVPRGTQRGDGVGNGLRLQQRARKRRGIHLSYASTAASCLHSRCIAADNTRPFSLREQFRRGDGRAPPQQPTPSGPRSAGRGRRSCPPLVPRCQHPTSPAPALPGPPGAARCWRRPAARPPAEQGSGRGRGPGRVKGPPGPPALERAQLAQARERQGPGPARGRRGPQLQARSRHPARWLGRPPRAAPPGPRVLLPPCQPPGQ